MSILPAVGLSESGGGIVVRPLVPETVRNLAVAIGSRASPAARAFVDPIDALSRV